MLKEIYDRLLFWIQADRIGPDIPFSQYRLYFRSTMKKFCKKKFYQFDENAEIRPGAYIIGCSQISIGKNVVIRPGVQMHGETNTLKNSIVIEDNVLIGCGVHFYVENHSYLNPNIPIINQGHFNAKKITVKNGAWIGANSIILPGVTIGKNTVVAAGAVVTKSFGDYVIIGGVPAKVIKTIKD